MIISEVSVQADVVASRVHVCAIRPRMLAVATGKPLASGVRDRIRLGTQLRRSRRL